MTVAPESSTAQPLVSSSPFTFSASWEPDGKPVSLALRHSANSFAQGDMSKTTLAESLGLERFAFGWFVQFALRWPLRPQRKQIGDELLEAPAGRSGLDHWALGAEVALPMDFVRVFGRGPC